MKSVFGMILTAGVLCAVCVVGAELGADIANDLRRGRERRNRPTGERLREARIALRLCIAEVKSLERQAENEREELSQAEELSRPTAEETAQARASHPRACSCVVCSPRPATMPPPAATRPMSPSSPELPHEPA